MFAAAPRNDSWRIAWLTAGGLAVLDLSSDEDAPKGLLFGGQLLTGTDPIYVLGSLSLSPDGKYALLMQQPTFGGSVQLRAFNLHLTDRQDALQNLTTDDLIKEACRVALIQDGSNRLRSAEQRLGLATKMSSSLVRRERCIDVGSVRANLRLHPKSGSRASAAAKTRYYSVQPLLARRV